MKLKPLPVGIEDFGKMRGQNYFYVDKTLFIKELLEKKGAVNLFTRPRRFGKSLNMSMLQYFFDIRLAAESHVFEGLNISRCGGEALAHQNRYPVINLTLKDVSGNDYPRALREFQTVIVKEYERHAHLLASDRINEFQKEYFKGILAVAAEKFQTLAEYEQRALSLEKTFADSLEFLCRVLRIHYGKNVIILVDEYDVPLENAHFNGYYQNMLDFIRSLFLKALKTNSNLEFSVMTGCLRVSKESIFTGLNNLHVLGIDSAAYGEYFGFTEAEVHKALDEYGLRDKEKEIQEWYNGYQFGETVVYNPWSVIQYLFNMVAAKESGGMGFPAPYWSNTSSNLIIKRLIESADEGVRQELETLIQGQSITKAIKGDIVYGEIDQTVDNLWNFLFFTGYLKKSSQQLVGENTVMKLEIPNREIRKIYNDKLLEWFNKRVKVEKPRELLNAILEKDAASLEKLLNQKLMDIISFHDTKESFYHGFLLGILSNLSGFEIKSNRESGIGRSDIYMKSKGISKQGVVFELKLIGDKDEPEAVCMAALKQIKEKRYDYELEQEGYRHILKYGIAFRGKECLIQVD